MKAILITGPPGAGKSPLGDYLEKQRPKGKILWHFDFGCQLREIINLSRQRQKGKLKTGSGQPDSSLQRPGLEAEQKYQKIVYLEKYFRNQELERICQSVERASLFEEKDRWLVRKILNYFMEKTGVGADDILILNGLPRHWAQLSWLQDLISIELVINLSCSEEIATKRIQANLEGERQGRNDDRKGVISRRYRLYLTRTEPLIDYFRQTGVPVIELPVGLKTTPEMIWSQIKSSKAFNQIL